MSGFEVECDRLAAGASVDIQRTCMPQISTRPGSSPGQATRPTASPVAFRDPPVAPAEVALACLLAVHPECSSPSPSSSAPSRLRQAGSAADTAVGAADDSGADSAEAPAGLWVLTAEAVYGDDVAPVPGGGRSLLASSSGPEADDDEGAEEDAVSAGDEDGAAASAAMRQKVYAPVQNAARCVLHRQWPVGVWSASLSFPMTGGVYPSLAACMRSTQAREHDDECLGLYRITCW